MLRRANLAVRIALAIAAVAACSGTGSPAASSSPGTSGPSPTSTASPLPIGGGATPASGPVASASVASPSAGAHPPGYYYVMLGGGRSGAGTYSQVSTIDCTSVDSGGSKLWTVAMIEPAGPVTQIDLQQNPSGWIGVTIGTSQDGEVGPWNARSDQPGETAAMQVIPIGDEVQIAAQASFTDTAKHTFTIDVAVDCSSVNAGGGGTD